MPKGISTAARERMERKPVLMPPNLIRRTDAMAEAAGVSFAEIVRRALESYEPEKSAEGGTLLESLAEELIRTNAKTLARLEEVERRLDETHAELEAHRHGFDR